MSTELEIALHACAWRGLAKPEAAPIVAALLPSIISSGRPFREMVSALLTSDDFLSALTPAGTANSKRAAKIVAHRFMARRSFEIHAAQAARWQSVIVSIVDDAETCQAARTMVGKLYPVGAYPIPPLAACDADICRCSIISVRGPSGRIHNRQLREKFEGPDPK